MTDLKLYNTLTRTKEIFEPEDKNNVRMYVCGPTVYDFAHIGNARPVIVFDVLFRLLRYLYGEDKVTYVRNITDVDDKINARALRDYPNLPLNDAVRNVTEKTANQFHADVKALGCLEPTHEPRATEHIEGMAAMIQTLLDKGHAYVAKGEQGREVLFRVASMQDYGQLSNRKLEDQQAGARIAVEAHKENAGDFVLWKESNENEPGWSGTFNGETIHGRPGWHIECSVMSRHHLGETFDIHGGGLDLIFPHHENEIAQSRCAHGSDKMAKVWMHNGYLQVEGKKMSKSDGNFVTIHDLLHTEKFGGRKWPGEVLRLAMLMTHYREPIDFSVKRLEEAEQIIFSLRTRVAEWNIGYFLCKPDPKVVSYISGDLDFSSLLTVLSKTQFANEDEKKMFAGSLGMLGLAPFQELQKWIDFDAKNETENFQMEFETRDPILISRPSVTDFLASKREDLDRTAVVNAVAQRLAYLNDKNFAEADRIRDELASQGIQLKDSKDLETGERITTWEVKR